MSTFLELHADVAFIDPNRRVNIDKILKQVVRFRDLIAVAQTLAKMTGNRPLAMSVSWMSQLTFSSIRLRVLASGGGTAGL